MAVGDKEGEIVKPRTDKRQYRRVVLRNSLEVLLISDPATDKVIFSVFCFLFNSILFGVVFAVKSKDRDVNQKSVLWFQLWTCDS